MKHLEIVVEPGGEELGASIRSEGEFLFTTVGANLEEITNNIKDLLVDFIAHEGRHNEAWENVNVDEIKFTYKYNLQTFFETFNAIKISELAKLAGINASLLRQYAGGFESYVSANQVKKIQDAVHTLGRQLSEITLV